MKYLSLILLLMIAACESPKDLKKSSVNKGKFSQEIDKLIEDTESLDEYMARDIILRGATSRQRVSANTILDDIKTSLFILNERPKDEKALQNLFLMKTELENIPMQRRDEEFFRDYLVKLNQLILSISKYQSLEISELRWMLWKDGFDNGFENFLTFGEKFQWKAGSFNRVGFAEARSADSPQWLITPLIDLTKVTNPAVKLNHLINIKASEIGIDATKINQEALKIMVSTDYQFGSPSAATWQRVPTKNFPLIKDFNPLLSKAIDLSSYSGEVVSIAFVLDANSDGHKLLWQIQEVQILGASSEKEITKQREDPTIYAFEHNFQEGFGSFKQEFSGETPAEFKLTSRNGDTYINVDSFQTKSNGTILLTSGPIELEEKSHSVQIKQAINFYKESAKDANYIQYLIKHNGGDWEDLNFTQVPAGDNWTPVESEWKQLPYKSGQIELGFRYTSGGEISQYPNWSLYSVLVRQDD